MPVWLRLTAVWVLLGLLALDCAGTVLTLAGVRHFFPQAEATHSRLASLTVRLGLWIFGRFERRMTRAYPQAEITRRKREKSDVFAPGCSFYKIFLLFFIGAFLGDIVETIFCYLTMGVWMSRSSLVWGRFRSFGAWRWRCHAADVPLQGQERGVAVCGRYAAGRRV